MQKTKNNTIKENGAKTIKTDDTEGGMMFINRKLTHARGVICIN